MRAIRTTFLSMNASDATFTCSTPASDPAEPFPAFTVAPARRLGQLHTVRENVTNTPNGSISNTATIASITSDPETSNNSSTRRRNHRHRSRLRRLSIDAVNGVSTASAGATMSVQVAIANKGPSTAHHVQLVNAVPRTPRSHRSTSRILLATSHAPAGCRGHWKHHCSALSFDQRSASDQPFSHSHSASTTP